MAHRVFAVHGRAHRPHHCVTNLVEPTDHTKGMCLMLPTLYWASSAGFCGLRSLQCRHAPCGVFPVQVSHDSFRMVGLVACN